MFRFLLFPVIFNICVIHPVKTGMLCVYKSNDKKSLQTWILKKSDMKPKKNWSIFSALYQTHSDDFFCLFEIETWKPLYHTMLKCNVCIAQCLLVGYYKSSDQSIKWISSPPHNMSVPSILLSFSYWYLFNNHLSLFDIYISVSKILLNLDQVDKDAVNPEPFVN